MENKKKQIKIELDESVGQGEYANFAIVSHTPAEFIMDFVRILPGMQKSKVKSRVIISPLHTKNFLSALKDNIEKYEQKFGEIKISKHNKAPNMNLSDKDILPN
tara:strand:- start:349 stop:660 length:312 start_codon:yes stop_codon:yes gene_type:complete